MRCANTERGCQWTGTVGTLDDHITSCLFALVPCPNKCEGDKGAGELLLIKKHLDQHLKTECPKRAYECLHCGEKGTFTSIIEDHDQVCEKKIVACPNKGSGCSVSMERGQTKEHVSSDCEYTEVACVYESLGCGVRIPRKNIIEHQENEDKVHLNVMLKSFSLLKEQHETLSEQHKTLSATVNIQHEQQLKNLTDAVILYKDQVKKLLGIVKMQEQLKTLSEGEAVVFQLSGYASKKEKNEAFYSTPFYTQPDGYKMCIRIDANGNGDGEGIYLSVFTKLLEGRYDNQLYWPFLGTVTFELLNQLGDDNHHRLGINLISSSDMRVGSNRGHTKFLPHSSLGHNPATNTQYLLDDTLYFRVSVDNHKPWLVCTDKVNSIKTINDYRTLNNETVIFKVTNFKIWKASQLSHTCSSIFTHPGGYKMCIKICLNGDGEGKDTHVSVFTELLEGRYDNQLQWPFLGTVTIELLNQLRDNKHHKRVIVHDASHDLRVGGIRGHSKFLAHSSLDHNPAANTQYLLDDTLYFRVSVKVVSHKPWLACTHNS